MTAPQTLAHQPVTHHAAVIGHSQTDAFSGYPRPDRAWPQAVEKMLRLQGYRVAVGNHGQGGDTSADALARVHALTRYGIPTFALVYLDVNDPKMAAVTQAIAGTASVAEVQTITQGGNTPAAILGGTFTATYGGQTTSPIAYNASAAAVQTSLNALSTITAAGGVTVTGAAGAWTVTFNTIGVRTLLSTDTSAMTTLFVQAIVLALKHGAFGGWDVENSHRGRQALGPAAVADQTQLPASGRIGQRHVVLADTAPAAGVTPPAWMITQGLAAANVGTAGTGGPSVWEFRQPRAGVAGWGRVAVPGQAPTAVRYVGVMGTNYYNFPTGGDTPATPNFTNARLRTALDAVVTAEKNGTSTTDPWVFRTDLYGYQRARVVAGTDPNFSADTTVVPTTAYSQAVSDHFVIGGVHNLHMNDLGHHVAALAVLDGGPAGTGLMQIPALLAALA